MVTAETLRSLPGLLGTSVGSCKQVPPGWTATGSSSSSSSSGRPRVVEQYPTRACAVTGGGLEPAVSTSHEPRTEGTPSP